jgi:hypothetical protein
MSIKSFQYALKEKISAMIFNQLNDDKKLKYHLWACENLVDHDKIRKNRRKRDRTRTELMHI